MSSSTSDAPKPTYIHTYMHNAYMHYAYMHAYIHTYIHTHTHTHTHTYVHMYTYSVTDPSSVQVRLNVEFIMKRATLECEIKSISYKIT
jgi:hypothetical protein